MNQPLPGPRPTAGTTPGITPGTTPGPRPGPTPGPRPTPGPIPAGAPAAAVDPDAIRRDVAALLEQADNVAASDESTGGEALVQLAKQAHLLEQAHTVITDALEKVDRV